MWKREDIHIGTKDYKDYRKSIFYILCAAHTIRIKVNEIFETKSGTGKQSNFGIFLINTLNRTFKLKSSLIHFLTSKSGF